MTFFSRYSRTLLRSLRIENLVLVRDGELVPGPGLTAITGETGAGKTILTQAVGLLLGAKGDAGIVGAAGTEAYVEAELDVPDGFFDDDELGGLAELRPGRAGAGAGPPRVFADGRTRAYAWGRAVAREDLAAAAERLIAMSGQFERAARPALVPARRPRRVRGRRAAAAPPRGARGASSPPPASGTTS